MDYKPDKQVWLRRGSYSQVLPETPWKPEMFERYVHWEEVARLEQQVEAQASRIETLEQLVTDAMEDDTDFMTEWDTAAQAYFDAQQEGE